MSFKNLEQRYNENVQTLYRGATQKFEGGRSSTGANDDPLITRKPGDGYWTRSESRGIPVTSTINDVKRLTLFTLSFRGVAFLLKQQLLQTGNTFESQRVLNPLFVVGNAVPFIHTKRSLDLPITARGIGRQLLGDGGLSRRLFGSGNPRTDVDLRKIGQLQLETYNKAAEKKNLVGGLLQKIPVIGKVVSGVNAKRSVGDGIHEWARARPELAQTTSGQIAGAIVGALTGLNINAIDNSGYVMTKQRLDTQKFQGNRVTFFTPLYGPTVALYQTYLLGTNNKATWTHGALKPRFVNPSKQILNLSNSNQSVGSPELSTSAKNNSILAKYQTGQYYSNDSETIESVIADQQATTAEEPTIFTPNSSASPGRKLANLLPASGDTQSFLEYFRSPGTVGVKSRTDGVNGTINVRNRAIGARIVTGGNPRRALSYIKDTSNILVKTGTEGAPGPYKNINSSFADPINISFAMGKAEPVYFRAYIKDLQETASPQYKDYQYIGRIEKFISYVSVQRTISFKLGVLAFAQDEVEGVWTRLNYLTGMVFPYGWTKGIFQPNIIRLTIGNVYYDQPGYITSLSKNFNELTESWDIDKEVPIAATVNMQFTLIEKSAKIATSPFYGITEDNTTIFNTSTTESPPTGEESLQTSVQQRTPSISTTSAVQQLRNIPVPKPPISSINTNTTIPLPTGLTSP
jgi:hypothetical protein